MFVFPFQQIKFEAIHKHHDILLFSFIFKKIIQNIK